MTVLVALEHARLDDVVTVSPQAAVGRRVVGAPSPGRAADRARPRRSPLSSRAPTTPQPRSPLYVGHGSIPRFVELMNAKARAARAHADALRQPARPRRAGTLLERARRDDAPDRRTAQPVHPHLVDAVDGDDRGRPHARVDRRPARPVAAPRRQDRSHERGRLVAGRRDPQGRRADHGLRPRRPERGAAKRRPRRPARVGPRAVPPGHGRQQPPRLRARRDRVRARAGEARRARDVVAPGAGRPPARRARRRQHRRSRCPSHAASSVGEVRVYSGRRLVARVAARHGDVGFRPSSTAGKVALVRPPHRPPSRGSGHDDDPARIVRKGHLFDRHRHTQRCARPLAHGPDLQARAPAPGEQRAGARGRQGDQRGARAEAARRARRRDGSRRRPHRHADRRGADGGGDPERLRPDPRRVAHVDGGRRPDLGDVHRDQRVGPEGVRATSSRSCSTSSATSAAAPRLSSSPARCRAGSTRASTRTRCAR